MIVRHFASAFQFPIAVQLSFLLCCYNVPFPAVLPTLCFVRASSLRLNVVCVSLYHHSPSCLHDLRALRGTTSSPPSPCVASHHCVASRCFCWSLIHILFVYLSFTVPCTVISLLHRYNLFSRVDKGLLPIAHIVEEHIRDCGMIMFLRTMLRNDIASLLPMQGSRECLAFMLFHEYVGCCCVDDVRFGFGSPARNCGDGWGEGEPVRPCVCHVSHHPV